MRVPRSAFLPILLAAAGACAVLYPANAVQAKDVTVPDELVHRVFAVASLPPAALAAAQAPTAKQLPEGKGRELALTDCTTCHAANTWTSQHHTRDQWNSILDQMVSKGLSASDEDLDTISEYLTTNFGPVTKDAPAASPAPASPAPATPPPPPQLP